MAYNSTTGRYGFLPRSERELLEAMAYPDQEVDITVNSANISFTAAYTFPNGETGENYYCRGIRNNTESTSLTIWYSVATDSTPRFAIIPGFGLLAPTVAINGIYGSSGAVSTTTGAQIKCYFKDNNITK